MKWFRNRGRRARQVGVPRRSLVEEKVSTGEPIELGGRRWKGIDARFATLEYDVELRALVVLAGIADPRLEPGETPAQFAKRLQDTLLASGRFFQILGCLLIPAEADSGDWTPEMQAETATFLRHLTAPQERDRMKNLMISFLIRFFERGLASCRASEASSGRPTAESEPTSPSTSVAATGSGSQ